MGNNNLREENQVLQDKVDRLSEMVLNLALERHKTPLQPGKHYTVRIESKNSPEFATMDAYINPPDSAGQLQDENKRLKSELYQLRLKQIGGGAAVDAIVSAADQDRQRYEEIIQQLQDRLNYESTLEQLRHGRLLVPPGTVIETVIERTRNVEIPNNMYIQVAYKPSDEPPEVPPLIFNSAMTFSGDRDAAVLFFKNLMKHMGHKVFEKDVQGDDLPGIRITDKEFADLLNPLVDDYLNYTVTEDRSIFDQKVDELRDQVLQQYGNPRLKGNHEGFGRKFGNKCRRTMKAFYDRVYNSNLE